MMQLIADPLRPGITETAVIDPLQLEAALGADAAQIAKAETEAVHPPIIPGYAREVGEPTEKSVVNADVKPVAP